MGRVGQVGQGKHRSLSDLPVLPDLPAPPGRDGLSRRDFLSAVLLAPAFARQTATARFISIMPLGNPGGAPAPPFGRLLGDSLDARLFTDLSKLGAPHDAPRTFPDALRTSTEDFFVRTAAPKALAADAWRLNVGGLAQTPLDLDRRALDPLVSSSGRYLLECSGNSDPNNLGLISTADWEGVPLASIVDRSQPPSSPYSVLVTGLDDMT